MREAAMIARPSRVLLRLFRGSIKIPQIAEFLKALAAA